MEETEFSTTYKSMHSAIQSWTTAHLKINVSAKRGLADYTLCNYRAKEPWGTLHFIGQGFVNRG